MKNKWNCIGSNIFAKLRCIKNIFTKNTGSGITHLLMLMLPGSGCTRTAGTAGELMSGGRGCVNKIKVVLL